MNEVITLTAQDVEVLQFRFGLGGTPKKTLEELAEYYGCSREQIRWRESKALRAARANPAFRRMAGVDSPENYEGETSTRLSRLVF